MANLPESAQWADSVYQIERNDPVGGGPDGAANKPLKDLTNRTRWLYEKFGTAFDNLGWMQLGLWAVGLEVSLPTQIVSFDGSWYRYRGNLDAPHVIAGSSPADDGGVWSGDNPDGVWVDVGDASLRENLGSSAAGMGGSLVALEQGNVAQAIRYVTPEMFGAVGDGVNDDLEPIQAAIDYMKTSPSKYAIVGHGDYAISNSLSISGFAYGFKMHVRSLRAIDDWPDYSNWETATPLISVGGNGSMVGLDIRCEYVNGNNKADWINIVGQGCGGSHFHAERLTNVVCGVIPKSITWPTASNQISGGYWNTGVGIAILLQRGTSGSSPIVEGWVIDVNFITGFIRGGVHLKNGAQYANIRGQFDFNGRYLSEMTLSSSFSGLSRGDTITNGDNSANVLAYYEQPIGTYKLLVDEGHNVSSDGSYFTASNVITNTDATWTSTVSAVKTPGATNWYPDIIHDFTDSPFGKCIISSPYCGGIVGGILHSSVFQFGNSAISTSNGINGAQFVHSSSVLSLRDVYRDNYVLDIGERFMAPYRHLYMRAYRIYGTEVYATLERGIAKTIRTFNTAGDGTMTNTREVWRATLSGELSGVSGEFLIYISSSGISLVDSSVTNVTLSVNGHALTAAQGSQSLMNVMFNFQRVL